MMFYHDRIVYLFIQCEMNIRRKKNQLIAFIQPQNEKKEEEEKNKTFSFNNLSTL